MDLVNHIAIASGLAWASGIRLYAVVLIAGLLGRFGYVSLPGSLEVLTHPLVLSAAGLMFTVEFFADKVPALDSLWDAIHTFIRVPGGAILAAMALGDQSPAIMLAAGLLGGTITAGTHLTKAGSRAAINTSPEPVSNMVTSAGEDALVVGGLLTAFHQPVIFLVLLGLFLLGMLWFLPKLWRLARRLLGRETTGAT